MATTIAERFAAALAKTTVASSKQIGDISNADATTILTQLRWRKILEDASIPPTTLISALDNTMKTALETAAFYAQPAEPA